MNNKFSYIKNEEVQKILKYVKNEPIFFGDNMRLLSEEEIINYKRELGLEIDNILPLIDLNDNNFLIYKLDENTFEKLNIVDGTFFCKIDSIENYLDLLAQSE